MCVLRQNLLYRYIYVQEPVQDDVRQMRKDDECSDRVIIVGQLCTSQATKEIVCQKNEMDDYENDGERVKCFKNCFSSGFYCFNSVCVYFCCCRQLFLTPLFTTRTVRVAFFQTFLLLVLLFLGSCLQIFSDLLKQINPLSLFLIPGLHTVACFLILFSIWLLCIYTHHFFPFHFIHAHSTTV